MEMTMEKKDWMTAKNLVIEQLKKDGVEVKYASDELELYSKKTSEYEINVDASPSITRETAWCNVAVKSSVQEEIGYISLCSIDIIRDKNRRLLEKYKNMVRGLNINVYYHEYLDVDCVPDEDDKKTKKYSVISELSISLRR